MKQAHGQRFPTLLCFSYFYHARPKIALIPGVKRMEIQTMVTLGSLVVHH